MSAWKQFTIHEPTQGEKLSQEERDLIATFLRSEPISAYTGLPYFTTRPLTTVGEWLDIHGEQARCIKVFNPEVGFEILIFYTREAEWVRVVSL